MDNYNSLVSYFVNNIEKKTYLPLLIYIISPLILYLIYNLGITFIAKIANFNVNKNINFIMFILFIITYLFVILCIIFIK